MISYYLSLISHASCDQRHLNLRGTQMNAIQWYQGGYRRLGKVKVTSSVTSIINTGIGCDPEPEETTLLGTLDIMVATMHYS